MFWYFGKKTLHFCIFDMIFKSMSSLLLFSNVALHRETSFLCVFQSVYSVELSLPESC